MESLWLIEPQKKWKIAINGFKLTSLSQEMMHNLVLPILLLMKLNDLRTLISAYLWNQ